MSKNLGTHGGARKGAGRKKTGIETIVKRIPVIIEARVNEMIEALSDEIPRSTCLPLDAMPIDTSHSDISIPLGVERIPAGFLHLLKVILRIHSILMNTWLAIPLQRLQYEAVDYPCLMQE